MPYTTVERVRNATGITHRRNVTWLWNVVDFSRKVRFSLGICEETRRVALVCPNRGGSVLYNPVVVKGLFLNGENGCEEEKRCLNFDCPRNKTTHTSYIRHFEWAQKAFKKEEDFKVFARCIKEAEKLLEGEIKRLDLSEPRMVIYGKHDESPCLVKIKLKKQRRD